MWQYFFLILHRFIFPQLAEDEKEYQRRHMAAIDPRMHYVGTRVRRLAPAPTDRPGLGFLHPYDLYV